MHNPSIRPAYRLECRHCSWKSTFYFDQYTPEQCPKCYRFNPKRFSLTTGTPYDHKPDFKKGGL